MGKHGLKKHIDFALHSKHKIYQLEIKVIEIIRCWLATARKQKVSFTSDLDTKEIQPPPLPPRIQAFTVISIQNYFTCITAEQLGFTDVRLRFKQT